MSAHTPGPWRFGETDKTFQHIDSDGRWWGLAKVVITVSNDPCGEGLANARLIAAAPELLNELAHLVRLLQPLEESGALNVPGLATLNAARAAIAKATQP